LKTKCPKVGEIFKGWKDFTPSLKHFPARRI